MGIAFDIADGVARLQLGADENRFSPEWIDALHAAYDQVEAAAAAVLVTSAEGKVFSNGLDLSWLMANQDRLPWYVDQVHGLLARTLALPVPTIAVVNGHAFGGGAMLALAHDWRAMRADRGFFCLPEVDIRIPFSHGMVALLHAKLTPQAAAATMLTGARLGAAQALSLGVVDAIADEAQLSAVAEARAADLAGKDPASLGVIKRRMYAAALASLARPYLPSGEVPGLPGA